MSGDQSPPQWPLAVHVVYESGGDATTTDKFAKTLRDRLSSGERATGVPVRLWRNQIQNDQRRLPNRVPLAWADRNIVVVLVDQLLFERRDEWNSCISAITPEARRNRDLILPFAIHAAAGKLESLRNVYHLAVDEPPHLLAKEKHLQSIYTGILRLLLPGLPQVFLCHAKSDGEPIAETLGEYLSSEALLEPFFDRNKIPHGAPVRETITDAIKKSVMLVVWTDALFDSPWCQFEIIEARRHQRPMLILDALTSGSTRLFPFPGNMPVVRWKGEPASIVSALLLELIRATHLEAVFRFKNKDRVGAPTFCVNPPDLVDSGLERKIATTPNAAPRILLSQVFRSVIRRLGRPSRSHDEPAFPSAVLKRTANIGLEEKPTVSSGSGAGASRQLWVYPDPPIRADELQVLRESVPQRRFLSLVEWQALHTASALFLDYEPKVSARPEPLQRMHVGVSLSASDTWAELGLVEAHQSDLSYDIALQLILLGATVVWGGYVEPHTFGKRLQSIVNTYQLPDRASQDHVALYVPFKPGVASALSETELEERRAFAQVELMRPPVEIGRDAASMDPSSAEGKALNALGLSMMRWELARACHARILLGGGMLRFQGIYPGLAEEAYEAVRNGRPLYVLAGFGGAARVVYDSITDANSPGAEQLLSASRTSGAAADEAVRCAHESLVAKANRPELEFAPEEVVQAFARLGLAGLSKGNGLSIEENARLWVSQDVHEIVGLVVKGLIAVRAVHPGDSG